MPQRIVMPGKQGARRRRFALAVLAVPGVLAGCEQPLPPANPAPLELAAEQLNVPAATLRELEFTASRLQAPRVTGAPVDPASPGVQRLRRAMAALERSYQREASTP